MTYIEKIELILRNILTEKRANHCIRTGKKAGELAKIYSNDKKFIKKAIIAGTLHDIAKEFNLDILNNLVKDRYIEITDKDRVNSIMHGFAGAEYIEQNIDKFNFINSYIDEDFLNSIRYHTIGRTNMSLLSKIVYLSDAIEEGREYIGVDEIRNMSLIDLDSAILIELDYKIKSLIDRKLPIHNNAIILRNYLINKGKYEYKM